MLRGVKMRLYPTRKWIDKTGEAEGVLMDMAAALEDA